MLQNVVSALGIVWVVVILGSLPCHAGQDARTPNILLILADDLGYGDLACYGHPVIETPNLDRLASEGVRLTQFYTTSPVCSPTRASLMTGRHPQRLGIHYADLPERLPRFPLPLSATTLAEVLKQHGYVTAHFGKWHLGEPPLTGMPRDHGFDFFFGSMGGRPSSSWMKYSRMMDAQWIANEDPARTMPGHATDVVTDRFLANLERVADYGAPFYINLWYHAPHQPLAPEVVQRGLYENREDLTEDQKVYYGTVSNLDTNIGRVLAKLKELKLEKDTFVFFTSDNGPETHKAAHSRGSAGSLRGIKTQLWEGGIRVPAIIRFPQAIRPGRTVDAVGSVLDFYPTVLGLTGGAIPNATEFDEGVNLLSSLIGSATPPERTLYWECHFGQRGGPSTPPSEGAEPSGSLVIREGDWKLHLYTEDPAMFRYPESGRRLLFKLDEDIGETSDLSAQHPDIADRLETKLRDWYAGLPKEGEIIRTSVPAPDTEEEANHIEPVGKAE